MDEQTSTPDVPDRSEGTPSWWGEGAVVSPSSGEGDESTSSSAHTRISDATHQSEEAFAPPAYWVTPEPSSTRRSASQLPPYAGATRRVGHSPRRSNRTRRILLGANAAVVLVIAVLATLLLRPQSQNDPVVVKSTAPSVNAVKADHYDDFPPGTHGKTCVDPGQRISTVDDNDYRIVGSGMSCYFVGSIVAQLEMQVVKNPEATIFPVRRVLSLETKQDYSLTCARHNHLSLCTGTSVKGEPLEVLIKDHVHG